MLKNDVDFRFVKAQADIVAVLEFYGIELSGEGEQRRGQSPFYDDNRSSLSVNIKGNKFNCHGSGTSGNIIDLVQLLDNRLSNPRRAAQQIANISGIPGKPDSKAIPPLQFEKPKAIETVAMSETIEVATEVESEPAEMTDGKRYNKPLTFKLKLEPVVAEADNLASEFVEAYGLPYERLADLEIGMGLRGSMKDRLAIPILNSDEELVAYCGRDVGLLAGDEPKYKFPDNFDKDLELYGWHVAQHFDRVVLVESFLSVIKHGGAASKFGDNGFGVTALMGTTISKSQIELLKQARSKIIVCMDGDEAGMTASPLVAGQIAKAGLWVNVCGYDGGKKPYDDNIETFCQLYGKI